MAILLFALTWLLSPLDISAQTVSVQSSVNQNHDLTAIVLEELNTIRLEQEQMKRTLTNQQILIQRLETETEQQQKIIQDYEAEDGQSAVTIDGLKSAVIQQQQSIEQLECRLATQETLQNDNLKSQIPAPLPELRVQHQAVGCLEDVLNLVCAGGGVINVTHAHYGQYLQTTACTEACCAPNPALDCTEQAVENDPGDWAYLKYTCDNKTECSVLYEGAVINDCETGYVADYMLVTYSCRPDEENGYAAFTAMTDRNRYYEIGDIVLFNSVISNIGNHYNPNTCSFMCPYDGVYSFTISFYSGYYQNMYIDLMRDDEEVIRGVADSISTEQLETHASISASIECSAGQRVWSRSSIDTGYMYGDSNRQSHFTGFLLHRHS